MRTPPAPARRHGRLRSVLAISAVVLAAALSGCDLDVSPTSSAADASPRKDAASAGATQKRAAQRDRSAQQRQESRAGQQVAEVSGAGAAATRSHQAMLSAARRLGLPPNGPDFMYQAPPKLPQLQNHDKRFRAPVQMVSGTERYLKGEYSYTDFVYDDMTTVYPDASDRTSPLWPRYHGNAADLLEFRLSTRDRKSLGFRFTLNTLMERDSTILALAFDSDDDAETGSATLPRDPGMPFPGTDHVLTTWGTGAEWSTWTGQEWRSKQLRVDTDLESNQITVNVPTSVANPRGRWRSTLATGLYDPETKGWLDLAGQTGASIISLPASTGAASRIVNLGFRLNEVPPVPQAPISLIQAAPTDDPDAPENGSPFQKQDAALAAGEPTRFAHMIDFDFLRAGGSRDTVPRTGMLYRLFASHADTVLAASDAYPPNGNPELVGEGKDLTSFNGAFLSPVQPYAMYVPETYRADQPVPFTFYLHCDGCYYWGLGDPGNGAVETMGTARDSIVVMPQGRGKSGFYFGYGEVDALEAWADVARHYTLDPTRPSISGGSGGGGGTYQIGLKWPQLFARALPLVPPGCRGLWTLVACTGGYETVHAHWAENARNLPFFHFADVASELTFYPATVQMVQGLPDDGFNSFEELGYRYRLWSVATDHVGAALSGGPITEFLGRYQIEQKPFHVTYVRMPSNDVPEVDLIHDRAYWLSDIELRDKEGTTPETSAPPCAEGSQGCSGPLARGVVDAVSLGFGMSDPTSTQYVTPGMTPGVVPFPYVETRRVWSKPGTVPKQDRIKITATNIRSLTIDPKAARVTCNVDLDVESDGPITIRLLGCPR